MQIIRDRTLVTDHWRHVPDDAPVGGRGEDEAVIVSLAHWQRDRQALRACGANLGLRLSATDALETIADELTCFRVIALEFGVFTDGRGYSQARLLRQRYGYTGEIRAVGDFLQDQVFFLERCGVNAFEIPAGQDIGETLNAFAEISITYQPAADTGELIFHRRRWAVSGREDR